MRELSVVVLGDGRWARALTGLLTHNQHKQPGHIRSVVQYKPRAGVDRPVAAAPRVTRRADSEDVTMTHMTAEALAGVVGALGTDKKAPPSLSADSDDATMMHMTADAFAGLSGSSTGSSAGYAPIKTSRGSIKAGSDDATMMHMTAESIGALHIKTPRGLTQGSIKADSEDATMMQMTAESLARAVGGSAGHGHDHAETLPASELKDIAAADLLLLAVPPASVRRVLRQVRSGLRPNQILVHCVDGFFPAEPENEQPPMLISDIVRQETPITRLGALAGPARPEDIEEWSPAGLVCGSVADVVFQATRQALGCQTLRIYSSNDLIGVEVARAMNCVVALASGVVDVLEFGPAARVMLVSRSAAEIARLGMAIGGKERTFLGLSGVGGLMLASEHRDSYDFQLGRMIGSGKPLAEAQRQSTQVADSISMIREATSLAESYGLRMPILATLHRIVFGNVALGLAIRDLLEDPNAAE